MKRILCGLAVIGVGIILGAYLVGHGTLSATGGLVVWAIAIAAGVVTFIALKPKGKADAESEE